MTVHLGQHCYCVKLEIAGEHVNGTLRFVRRRALTVIIKLR